MLIDLDSAPQQLIDLYNTIHWHRHYVCAWDNSLCMCGCDHLHTTVASAVRCFCFSRQAGSYVVAVEHGKYRKLNTGEEALYQMARRLVR